MNEIDKAWLAGFFDGEGHVSYYTKYKNGNKHIGWKFIVPNTDKRAIDHCFELTGKGNIYTKTKYLDHHKDQYLWIIGKKTDIVIVLNEIYPYCIIKKEQIKPFLKLPD